MKRVTSNPTTRVTIINGKALVNPPGDASDFAKTSRITQVLVERYPSANFPSTERPT